MRKYIILVAILLGTLIFGLTSYYVMGLYINFDNSVKSFTSSDAESIYVNGEKFTIKGVNLGAGIPGHFATDYAIDKETYKRWFASIQKMGANTIRVYTILSPEFYEAIYEYNKDRDVPLYLIHGVWVDDYVLNSKVDGLNERFRDKLLKDTRVMIDVIHGRRYIPVNKDYANGFYTKNISKWVIGYVLGVEWDDVTVAYTDHKYNTTSYQGDYISTKEGTPFINMLAYLMDNAIGYESKKYNQQRLVALSNWPTTDPFDYNEKVIENFQKCAKVDVEKLLYSDKFIGGTFASYHVYPYYPDYLNYEENKSSYVDETGKINTYYAYLKKLNEHHKIPVVISEFGVSTGRGMAQVDENTGFNQGHMNEEEQGKAIISMYNSIIKSGSAGGMVFTWQDEWFKRTWNTMQNVNLNFTPYWSDVQTNEQYFGLLSFEPGTKKNATYIDGDITEWNKKDIISSNNKNTLSMKYDERYLYFMAKIDNYNGKDTVYIPIDITPNSGSKKTSISNNSYDRNIDFLIEIADKNNSRVYVQEYYDALLETYSENILGRNLYFDPPKANSEKFNTINLILKNTLDKNKKSKTVTYETGLLKYGNGNPNSKDYNSLADYIIKGDYIEIRIPWQLLNFSNPSKMTIHDDYYKNYGIEDMKINKIYAGIGTKSDNLIHLDSFTLKAWGTKITYHERLKQSYYILKEYWNSDVK